jgi:aminopeptidase
MTNPRHEKLARVLVHYSLQRQPGDRFQIEASAIAAPLVRAVYQIGL